MPLELLEEELELLVVLVEVPLEELLLEEVFTERVPLELLPERPLLLELELLGRLTELELLLVPVRPLLLEPLSVRTLPLELLLLGRLVEPEPELELLLGRPLELELEPLSVRTVVVVPVRPLLLSVRPLAPELSVLGRTVAPLVLLALPLPLTLAPELPLLEAPLELMLPGVLLPECDTVASEGLL